MATNARLWHLQVGYGVQRYAWQEPNRVNLFIWIYEGKFTYVPTTPSVLSDYLL